MLSASAIALIALTGTAYATDLVDLPETETTAPEGDNGESSTQESTSESTTGGEVSEEVNDTESVQESQETSESENTESTDSTESEVNNETEEVEDTAEETQESEESEVGEVEEVEEEVDEKVVVPSSELPYNEETGLLDFAEYHKIAKGRALPRELTEEEKQYFEEYVIVGKQEESRPGVVETEYSYIKIYPENYYINEENLDMKWDKFTLVQSELLTLEQQEAYLAEREAQEKELLDSGFVYDKEKGEFVLELSDSEDVNHGVEMPEDLDGVFAPDPVGNDDVVQEIHYQEKAIYDNLADYDELRVNEFIEEYGANFIFRGVLPAGGFMQKEYELTEGLTLAVEAESVQDEGEDNIILTWAVVKEPIRHDSNVGGQNLIGKYNFATNPEHDFYIEGNVLETGTARIRDDGKYTPAKVYVEYTDSKGVPHAYLLVADGILEGESRRQFSEIVGYIEYGWENIYDDGFEPGIPNEDTEDGDGEDPETGNGDNGTGNENPGTGDNNQGNEDSSEEGNTDGNDKHNELPDWVKPIDKNKDGVISEEEAKEAGYDTSVPFDESHPLYEYTEEGSGKVNADGTEEESSNKSEDKFQQTGTAVLWGAIVSGLGLGAVGAYFRKKSKKAKEDEKEE